MNTTNYPIVTTEHRSFFDNENWLINANIINLGICKIVQFRVVRRSSMSIPSSWTTIMNTTDLPQDLHPPYPVLAYDSFQNVEVQINNYSTVTIRANTQKTVPNFDVTLTYIVT